VVNPLGGRGEFIIVDSKEEGYKFESSPLVSVDKRVLDDEIVEKICSLLHDLEFGYAIPRLG